MNTFIWQDGTVTERPYVEIDGTKYYVQDGSYSGGTPVSSTNLNQMQTILNQNITDAIESGTGYIKYNDGTMICYGSETGTGTLYDYWTNFDRLSKSGFTFAETFVSIPVVNAITKSGSASLSIGVENISITGFDATIYKPKNTSNTNYNFDYVAIGKWK